MQQNCVHLSILGFNLQLQLRMSPNSSNFGTIGRFGSNFDISSRQEDKEQITHMRWYYGPQRLSQLITFSKNKRSFQFDQYDSFQPLLLLFINSPFLLTLAPCNNGINLHLYKAVFQFAKLILKQKKEVDRFQLLIQIKCMRQSKFVPWVQLYNIVMQKINLKRKKPNNRSSWQPLQPLTRRQLQLPLAMQNHQKASIPNSIPQKLIQPPTSTKKQASLLICPLLVQGHTYPQKVKKHLDDIKTEKSDVNREIGIYREINWFFNQRTVILWISDTEKMVTVETQEVLTSVAIGQLEESCLPSKLKRHYLLVTAYQNTIDFYSLNPYTLEVQLLGPSYKFWIKHAIEIQKIKFVMKNMLLVASCTGIIQLFEFSDSDLKRKGIYFPFYKALIPITSQRSKKIIKELLYTPKRIFVLMTEYIAKNWLSKKVDYYFFDQAESQFDKKQYVVVYNVQETNLVQEKRITQGQIKKKLKSTVSDQRASTQIRSIYIDSKNDQEGQLGIVTSNGCFLVFKNTPSVFLSKEPIFIPFASQLGSCAFLEEKKLDSLKPSSEETHKKKSQFLRSSLGYQNISLTSDGILWIGEERIDGILSNDFNGEIYEKNSQFFSTLTQDKEWGIFGFHNHYTIKQLPLRHFVALLIYIKGNIRNEYLGQNYPQQKFEEFMQKKINTLRPENVLRYLIEIVILQERTFSINEFTQEIIKSQVKDEKVSDFKDWKHILQGKPQKKQIMLNQRMFLKIWSLILLLQYKQIPSTNQEEEEKSLATNNAYWQAMHTLYYNTISPILDWNYQEGRFHKKELEDIQFLLTALQSFIENKQNYEDAIKKNLSTDPDKPLLDTTQSSIISTSDLAEIDIEAKLAVQAKIFIPKRKLLQSRIKSSINTTNILLSIYFNTSNYLAINKQKKLQDIGITTFKDLLVSKECQKRMKRLVVQNSKFMDLEDLKLRLPLFDIQQDLTFKRCQNKVLLEKLPKQEIDCQQLANYINSDYFQELEKIFGDRIDLKLRVLDLYSKKLKKSQQQSAEAKNEYFNKDLNRQLLPKDEKKIWQEKKIYFEDEFELILSEEKKCITQAVQKHAKLAAKRNYSYTPVIDKIILTVSGRIALLEFLETCLNRNQLTNFSLQIQKTKLKYYSERRVQIKDPFYTKHIPKPLFPDRQRS